MIQAKSKRGGLAPVCGVARLDDETPPRYSSHRSPLGVIYAAMTLSGLTDVEIRAERKGFLERLVMRHGLAPVEDGRVFAGLFTLLDSYFAGSPVRFDIPLAPSGTAFEKAVWGALVEIPWGATQSYGRVAARLSNPGAARAVGGACGANPLPIIVPCHRVLSGDGTIGGYSGGLDIKRRLLEIEGVRIQDIGVRS